MAGGLVIFFGNHKTRAELPKKSTTAGSLASSDPEVRCCEAGASLCRRAPHETRNRLALLNATATSTSPRGTLLFSQ